MLDSFLLKLANEGDVANRDLSRWGHSLFVSASQYPQLSKTEINTPIATPCLTKFICCVKFIIVLVTSKQFIGS